MNTNARMKLLLVAGLLLLVQVRIGPIARAASDTGYFDNWDVTITRYERRTAIESGSISSRGVYLLVYLTVRYSGSSRYAVSFSPANLRVIDGGGIVYGPRLSDTFKVREAEFPGVDVAVPPGGTLRTVVVFEIPQDALDLSLTTAEGSFFISLTDGRVTSSHAVTGAPIPWQDPIGEPDIARIYVGDLAGFQDGVARAYLGLGINVSTGTFAFVYSAFRFGSSGAASSAMDELARRHLDPLVGNLGGVKHSQSLILGDESEAYSTKIRVPDLSEVAEFGLVVIRKSNIVHLSIAYAIATDPVVSLISVESKVIDRRPETQGISIDDNGLRTGGLWSVIPVLTDLPAGFVRMLDNRYL